MSGQRPLPGRVDETDLLGMTRDVILGCGGGMAESCVELLAQRLLQVALGRLRFTRWDGIDARQGVRVLPRALARFGSPLLAELVDTSLVYV